MKICVIMPPTPGLFKQNTNVPLGPLYIAAVLEKNNQEVELVSLLDRDIPSKWPRADLYAIGFATVQVGVVKGIVELIRSQYPMAKFLAAGCHPSALPVETLNLGFDGVLVGEGENTIFRIIYDLPELKDKIYYGSPVLNLDEIPFPARHLLPEEDLYNGAASATLRTEHGVSHVAGIITSRGCPGKCAFCANNYPTNRTRYRSAENVVGEMKWLVDRGINCFKMQDDTMTLSTRHVVSLADEIEKTFDKGQIFSRVATRVDTFSEKIIPSLKQMGVEVVSFGIETGSQKILDIIEKGTTVGQAERAIRLAKEHGFSTWGFIVFGLPGENEETVDQTISFLERNRDYLDTAGWNTLVPYPGSPIGKYPESYRMNILHRDWNRYYVTQKKDIVALPYDVSYSEMIRLKNKLLQAFIDLGYSRPEWEGDL